MSDQKTIIEAFTEMSTHYESTVDSELKRFWGWSYEGFIHNLIDMASLEEDDVVLDIATGTGVIPAGLLQRGKSSGQIVGLDITLAMLKKAGKKLHGNGKAALVCFTCGSAMQLPFQNDHFDQVFCALATHHLDVPVLVSEIKRVLKPGGKLAIADVGGSALWRFPLVNFMLRALTFLYFLPKEGRARAASEAAAVNNVFTEKEWLTLLDEHQFQSTSYVNLPASHFWSPKPFVIRAIKVTAQEEGEVPLHSGAPPTSEKIPLENSME